MGLVNGAILPNQVTNMTSVTVNGAKIVTGGHDPMWAGTVLSAYMVTVVIAKISLGAIYDRFGLRFGNILGSVACIIACVALCFPTTDLGPIVAAVSFGVGTCMGTITPTIAASKQFGMADLGKVTGTITSLEMVGGTVGAIVSGVLFDATGSFASTWIVCLACSVVMLVFLLASEPIAAKLRASVAGGVAGRRLFLFACSARGCPGSRMDARTVIRFPGQPRVYEMSSFPPSPRDHVIRRGRRKRDHKPRRRVWPNESPYPRSVRHAAALLLCAV